MKEIIIKVYSYEELPEEIQKKVLLNQSEINIMNDWWEYLYADADNIQLSIKGFDIDRGTISMHFHETALETAKLIKENHGVSSETYKDVIRFENGDTDEDDLLQHLKVSYLDLLQKEYKYLTSDKAIIETIQSNEYTFTIEGKMMNS